MNQLSADVQSDLYARAFKGLLLDADIGRMEDEGRLLRQPQIGSTRTALGRYETHFSRELQDRAEKMTYVYTLFYCFENSVRELVSQRLEERKGAGWWTSVPENVRKRVGQKKKEIEDNKWHEAVIGADINHTLFGDLAATIIKEWTEFADLFPGQHWVKVRLDELERSRNVIAHGNLLPDSD